MATHPPKVQRAVVMLDQAAGDLRVADGQVLGFDVLAGAREILEKGRQRGLDVTIALPGSFPAPEAAGLTEENTGFKVVTVPPDRRLLGSDSLAAGLSADDPATALVSADRALRGEAGRAGFQPAPHVALLPMMSEGKAPIALRMTGERTVLERLGRRSDVVPMYFRRGASGSAWVLIAIASDEVPAHAVMMGVEFSLLPYDPMTEDLVWIRIDERSEETRAVLSTRRILHAEPAQVLIALGPDEDAHSLHLHGAHGHAEVLMPDPGLLRPARLTSRAGGGLVASPLPDSLFEPVPPHAPPVVARSWVAAPVDFAAGYGNDLDRYCGVVPLDAQGTIISRHTAHPDNKRAEAALLSDLAAIGYSPYRHDFSHAGQTLSNIIADLPGTGTFRIQPEAQEQVRQLLRSAPQAPELEALQGALGLPPGNASRAEVERLFGLEAWMPWWQSPASLAGGAADLIVVGCHLDSTAASGPGYRPATDPAPGRDDDGSGIAAVLALARSLWPLRGTLTHTIRFCFFNAEEAGLVGSKAYASKLKALDAPVRAAICLDMIGYNSDALYEFEIHAGYSDPAIRDLSLPLASTVAAAAADLGKLVPAQVYRGTSWGGAPDRTIFDGAIDRSDHAAFHQQGYPAVLLSEDFFANLGTEPAADPNPNYHRAADTSVDLTYATHIVAAAGKAILSLATQP